MYDKEVITEKKTQQINCTCVNKNQVAQFPTDTELPTYNTKHKLHQIILTTMEKYNTKPAKVH